MRGSRFLSWGSQTWSSPHALHSKPGVTRRQWNHSAEGAQQNPRVSLSLILTTLFCSMEAASIGFVIVIDRRRDKWSSIKASLTRIAVNIYFYILL